MSASRAWAIAAVLLLAGCETPQHACGTYPADGGPPIVTTRDGEFCELLRGRFHRWLMTDATLTHVSAEVIWDKSETWHREPDLESLVARIGKDTQNPELAARVADAVEWIRNRSTRPFSADCETEERCLVRRGAHGARVALNERDYIIAARGRERIRANNPDLAEPDEPPELPPNPARIELEELED